VTENEDETRKIFEVTSDYRIYLAIIQNLMSVNITPCSLVGI
jgi:hypothetical protein